MKALYRNLVWAALLFSVPLGATTVPRLELTAIAHSAQLIVHGRIISHSSRWDDTHQFIWTHYVLEIKEALKGKRSTRMTIAEPGGSVGGTTMTIAGAPEYQDGEEVIVFLERTPIGYWRCYGWGQGKYTVTRSANGKERVRTSLAGLELVGKSPLREANAMELGQFKRLVLSEVKR